VLQGHYRASTPRTGSDDAYFARRAAEHRKHAEAAQSLSVVEAHRRMAAAYEREAVRLLLDREVIG
jgi:hypothetical protein